MTKTEQIKELFTGVLNNFVPLSDSEDHSQQAYLDKGEIAAYCGILLNIEELLFESLKAVEEATNE